MKEKEILKIVEEYVKNNGDDDVTAHDWWHIYRVYNIANKINHYEKADEFIVLMIVLLHDIFDWKFYPDINITNEIKKLLKELGVIDYISQKDLDNICHSIANLSFKGFKKVELSKEGQVAQDSDRLDILGAIGIARVFAFFGKNNRPIYDPELGIIEVKTDEEFQKLDRPSINYFYEKVIKLKDLMNTETAKKMAIKRHKYLEDYLMHFFEEWEANDIDDKE